MFIISFNLDGEKTYSTSFKNWYDANELRNELKSADKYDSTMIGRITDIEIVIDDKLIPSFKETE